MPEVMTSKPPLLVFSDDWGRHPSSCQHLVREMLGHRSVTWVNTIGTRPPRLDWATAKRVFEKLKQWSPLSGGRQPSLPATQGEGAHGGFPPTAPERVLSPKMWPSFKGRFARSLNKKLLLRALKPIVAAMPQPPIVVSTLPLVTDLVGELPASKWVYYCVDDFGVWPGYDGVTMRLLEREFVAKVDTVVAVSETLVSHLKDLGRDSHLLTHGVDFRYWEQSPGAIPDEFHGLEAPFVVFWGVIDRRMDVDFVTEIAKAMPKGTLVLLGPQADPDPVLFRLPKVAVRPAVPFERLPSLAAVADVLVMPYIDAPVTRAMQPLKLKEYLATGKPVVVRGLPSTYSWADACDVCDSSERFAQAVGDRLREGILPTQPIARERLSEEGWGAKAKLLEGWMEDQRNKE
jgi:glycosyltransferase involved in cell wall biosynthesis